jgi:hypothetical protein
MLVSEQDQLFDMTISDYYSKMLMKKSRISDSFSDKKTQDELSTVYFKRFGS